MSLTGTNNWYGFAAGCDGRFPPSVWSCCSPSFRQLPFSIMLWQPRPCWELSPWRLQECCFRRVRARLRWAAARSKNPALAKGSGTGDEYSPQPRPDPLSAATAPGAAFLAPSDRLFAAQSAGGPTRAAEAVAAEDRGRQRNSLSSPSRTAARDPAGRGGALSLAHTVAGGRAPGSDYSRNPAPVPGCHSAPRLDGRENSARLPRRTLPSYAAAVAAVPRHQRLRRDAVPHAARRHGHSIDRHRQRRPADYLRSDVGWNALCDGAHGVADGAGGWSGFSRAFRGRQALPPRPAKGLVRSEGARK